MEASIRTILESAVWAPSGDNSQPWSFVLHGNTVLVHLDATRDNPILNFRLSGTYIAHGALIENIILAAPVVGLEATVQILPDPSDPYCTARITFVKSHADVDLLARSMRERHTNRKFYKKRHLAADVLTALEDSVIPITEVKFYQINDHSSIRTVAKASALMEQVALETPELRRLFVTDILWSETENRSGKQGLFIDTMELPPPARFAMRHIAHSMIASVANAVGFSRVARFSNTQLYASAPMMGLITIQEETPTAYLAAGRAFQRAWLQATSDNLAFQPVTGILFLARSIQQGQTQEFLPRHIQPIILANAAIKKQFTVAEADIPAMLFRIGYADSVTARSFRRSPEVRVE